VGRFWAHRSEDGLKRELQLLVNFLCNVTGGPMLYTGRDMKTSHKGMRIDEQDWKAFVGHASATRHPALAWPLFSASKDRVLHSVQ
jgi:hemoglobin